MRQCGRAVRCARCRCSGPKRPPHARCTQAGSLCQPWGFRGAKYTPPSEDAAAALTHCPAGRAARGGRARGLPRPALISSSYRGGGGGTCGGGGEGGGEGGGGAQSFPGGGLSSSDSPSKSGSSIMAGTCGRRERVTGTAPAHEASSARSEAAERRIRTQQRRRRRTGRWGRAPRAQAGRGKGTRRVQLVRRDGRSIDLKKYSVFAA